MCSLEWRQHARRNSVVGAAGCLYTVDARSEFCDVQIDFKNPLFRPDRINCQCQTRLDGFSDKASIIPEKQILGRLLRDGTGTSQALSSLIFRDRLMNSLEINPVVLRKSLVFTGDHRQRHPFGYLRYWHPFVLQRLAGITHLITSMKAEVGGFTNLNSRIIENISTSAATTTQNISRSDFLAKEALAIT